MTKKEAQLIVIVQANTMLYNAREIYERDLRVWREERKGTDERVLIYQNIATTLTGRDLPETDVEELVSKIVGLEWNPKARRVMENFWKSQNLTNLAKEYCHNPVEEVFDEVISLFPQANKVINKYFEPITDYFEQHSEYLVVSKLWRLTDIFLMDELDLSQNERKIIAGSWLANYFFHGMGMVEGTDFYSYSGQEGERELIQGIRLLLSKFGVEDKEIKDVAQSVTKMFLTEGMTLRQASDILNNISTMMDPSELSWQAFEENELIKILETSRKSAWLNIADPPTLTIRQMQDRKEKLIYQFSFGWWEKAGALREIRNKVNEMSDEDFFELLDTHLVDDAKVVGERLGLDVKKIEELLVHIKDPDQIVEGVEGDNEDIGKKRRAEAVQKAKERDSQYKKKLEQALKITKKK